MTATTEQKQNKWLVPVRKMSNLRAVLDARRDEIAGLLPKHLSIDKIFKMALVAADRDSKILKCTSLSVLQAVKEAADLGLDFSGTLGEGYLIPYGQTLKFMPGYRGYIRLAHNSGKIADIDAHIVFEDDEFTLRLGTARILEHVPADRKPDDPPGVVRGAYAIAFFSDGTPPKFEYMNLAELERIREMSPYGNKGPWKEHRNEMYRKTCIRRLAKYLPLSPELEKLIVHDNVVDVVGDDPTGEIAASMPPAEYQDETSRLANELAGSAIPEDNQHDEGTPSEARDESQDEYPMRETDDPTNGSQRPADKAHERVAEDTQPDKSGQTVFAPDSWPALPDDLDDLREVFTDIVIEYGKHIPRGLKQVLSEKLPAAARMNKAQLVKLITEARDHISTALPPRQGTIM